ncbi:hypothetical protein [Lentzea sp. NEAU-D7]|uniref:hypothetical protein n=1 Tax=Lentzea sp. NEAU-D7 TaxID=2994667 RepID=UPI00224B6B25|nr:hypothetical protein [Lentzea sp. NEAU-D7]MCX2947889.1 hypothetical protein [Lentzea sp. NEAU-D7]
MSRPGQGWRWGGGRSHARGHAERRESATAAAARCRATGDLDLPAEVREATRRWDRLLEAELGDLARAHVVRLVGDGLLLNALTTQPPAAVVLPRWVSVQTAVPLGVVVTGADLPNALFPGGGTTGHS